MNDKIIVHMFGEFSITYQDKTISAQSKRSKKIWLFLEYLLAYHGKDIPEDTIIDLLWPDDSKSASPANALKTLLHRTRDLLSALGLPGDMEPIIRKRSTYSWNSELPVEIDTAEFDRLAIAAMNASEPQIRLDYFLKAIELYKGDFIPGDSMEPWAVPLATYYHSSYLKIVHNAIATLEDQKRYHDILNIATFASSLDPYDEQLHYYIIISLLHTGKQQAALKQYQYVTDLMYNEFGVNPSKRIIDLYEQLNRRDHSESQDLESIREDLKETASQQGAYYCDYSVFKHICHIQTRASIRSPLPACLGIFSLGLEFSSEDPAVLSAIMKKLGKVIQLSLRKGDVYTRYSVTQYLVLLPGITSENSEMVANRIIGRFYRENPKIVTQIKSSQMRMDPSELM